MTNIKTDRAIGIEKEFDNLSYVTLRNEIISNYPHLNFL